MSQLVHWIFRDALVNCSWIEVFEMVIAELSFSPEGALQDKYSLKKKKMFKIDTFIEEK